MSRLTRADLALLVGVPVDRITAFEIGTDTPTATVLEVVADALAITVAELMGPVGADDSWEYWGVICAAMPPMSEDAITTVATVLRRIDARRASSP